jgi:hypothetical protein
MIFVAAFYGRRNRVTGRHRPPLQLLAHFSLRSI